jgi:hypothetical protein
MRDTPIHLVELGTVQDSAEPIADIEHTLAIAALFKLA